MNNNNNQEHQLYTNNERKTDKLNKLCYALYSKFEECINITEEHNEYEEFCNYIDSAWDCLKDLCYDECVAKLSFDQWQCIVNTLRKRRKSGILSDFPDAQETIIEEFVINMSYIQWSIDSILCYHWIQNICKIWNKQFPVNLLVHDDNGDDYYYPNYYIKFNMNDIELHKKCLSKKNQNKSSASMFLHQHEHNSFKKGIECILQSTKQDELLEYINKYKIEITSIVYYYCTNLRVLINSISFYEYTKNMKDNIPISTQMRNNVNNLKSFYNTIIDARTEWKRILQLFCNHIYPRTKKTIIIAKKKEITNNKWNDSSSSPSDRRRSRNKSYYSSSSSHRNKSDHSSSSSHRKKSGHSSSSCSPRRGSTNKYHHSSSSTSSSHRKRDKWYNRSGSRCSKYHSGSRSSSSNLSKYHSRSRSRNNSSSSNCTKYQSPSSYSINLYPVYYSREEEKDISQCITTNPTKYLLLQNALPYQMDNAHIDQYFGADNNFQICYAKRYNGNLLCIQYYNIKQAKIIKNKYDRKKNQQNNKKKLQYTLLSFVNIDKLSVYFHSKQIIIPNPYHYIYHYFPWYEDSMEVLSEYDTVDKIIEDFGRIPKSKCHFGIKPVEEKINDDDDDDDDESENEMNYNDDMKQKLCKYYYKVDQIKQLCREMKCQPKKKFQSMISKAKQDKIFKSEEFKKKLWIILTDNSTYKILWKEKIFKYYKKLTKITPKINLFKLCYDKRLNVCITSSRYEMIGKILDYKINNIGVPKQSYYTSKYQNDRNMLIKQINSQKYNPNAIIKLIKSTTSNNSNIQIQAYLTKLTNVIYKKELHIHQENINLNLAHNALFIRIVNILWRIDSNNNWLKYEHIDYFICCIFKFSSIQQYFYRNANESNLSMIKEIIEEILYKKLHKNEERFIFYVENLERNKIYKKIQSYYARKGKIIPSIFPNHKLKYNHVYDQPNQKLAQGGICIICDWFVRPWYFVGINCSICRNAYHIYCIKNSFKYHQPKCFPTNYNKREYIWQFGNYKCFLHFLKPLNYHKNSGNFYFCSKIYIEYNKLIKCINDRSLIKCIPKNSDNGYIVLTSSLDSYHIVSTTSLNYFTNATLKTSLIFNNADMNHDRLKINSIGPNGLSDLNFWKKSIKQHKNNLYDEIIDKFGLRNPVYYIDYYDDEELEYTYDAHNYYSVTNEQVFHGNSQKFGTITRIGWFSPNEMLSIQFCICLLLCSSFNVNAKTYDGFRKYYHINDGRNVNHYHQYTNYVNHADYITERIKLFISGGVYQQVAYGIHKLIAEYVGSGGRTKYEFYSPTTFGVTEQKFKQLKQDPIISPIPSIHDDDKYNYYDPLTKSLYDFLLYRCYAIFGKSNSFFIDQMQFNMYGANGFIKGHVDWIGWFLIVLMMKLFNDGALHFGLKGGHCNEIVLNTTYYFALMVGEIFEMKDWSLTHYFHSISSWMHEKAGITLILRQFSKYIEFYYPSSFKYKDPLTTKKMYKQLKQAKAKKIPKDKVEEFRQSMIKKYLSQIQNNNNTNDLSHF